MKVWVVKWEDAHGKYIKVFTDEAAAQKQYQLAQDEDFYCWALCEIDGPVVQASDDVWIERAQG